MMKKLLFALFTGALLLTNISLWAQNEIIDLEGVFDGKYRYDNLNSLQWQPNTDNYSYLNDEGQMLIINAKNGKQSQFAPADTMKAYNLNNLKYFRWIDESTIFDYMTQSLYCYKDKKMTVTSFDKVDMENLIDLSYKNQLFIIKNDEGVFVQSKLNNFEPVLMCPDTGKDIVFGEAVHRSEWGINEGQYISPNANYIAFYRMDQSMVEDYPLVNTTTPIATVENIKYPMAGRTCHQVKVGIYDVVKSSKANKPVYHYIQ